MQKRITNKFIIPDSIKYFENDYTIDSNFTRLKIREFEKFYTKKTSKYLPELVKTKSSYQNYREFMLKVLECKRNEENKPLDNETAKRYADELYNAGGARKLGEEQNTIFYYR